MESFGPHQGNGRDGIVVPPPVPGDGRLADNIVHFARVLRKAGLKPGPGAVIDASAGGQLRQTPRGSARVRRSLFDLLALA